MKPTRRRFLQAAALSPAGALPPRAAGAPAAAPPPPAAAAATGNLAASSPSALYSSLGIKPVINGVGVVTVLGGSIMPPEVLRAMEEASRFFIPLPDLEKKAGARIAELLRAPAATPR